MKRRGEIDGGCCLIVLMAIFVLLMIVCGSPRVYDGKIEKEGYDAASIGIPATACPYPAVQSYAESNRHWMLGWIKKQSEAKLEGR